MRRSPACLPLVVCLSCGLGCSAGRVTPAGEAREVRFRITYSFTSEGRTRWAKVVALLPRSIAGRQVVRQVECSPAPLRMFEVGGNRYAEFLISRPGGAFDVRIAARVAVLPCDLSSVRGAAPADADERSRCLRPEPYLEADDARIRRVARALGGREELDTVRRIYDFVKDHMTHTGYDRRSRGGGAAEALTAGRGDCTDYADLMVALCRARGIPARCVLGIFAWRPAGDIQHSWVEAYLRGRGWAAFDPTADDCTGGANASFERLRCVYVRLSTVRNDPVLENHNAYAVFRWWGDRLNLREKYELD